MTSYKFSKELETWLQSKQPKTIEGLQGVFGEKSFAVAFLLLMITAALPIPTGGITHIFEVITILLALELVIGRSTLWLPKKLRHHTLGDLAQKKVLPRILKLIRWLERFSRPRLSQIISSKPFRTFAGVVVIILTIAALLAPPFSGLDTLPALGVVLISLALILEDFVLFIAGALIGGLGIFTVVGLGKVALRLVHNLF